MFRRPFVRRGGHHADLAQANLAAYLGCVRNEAQSGRRLTAARVFNLWVLVKPSSDVQGEWVAHCLELDVVTQGRSIQHAFQMAAEAATMVVVDDLDAKCDPLDRRAPDQCWTDLWKLLKSGKPVTLSEIEASPGRVRSVAAQLVVQAIQLQNPTHKRPSPVGDKRAWDVPAMWAKSRESAVPAAG